MLFVYYQDTGLTPPNPLDRLYAGFIWQYLPTGIAGLVIAAILAAAMSNLSAALNSLASTTVMDFYKPMTVRRGEEAASDDHYLKLARAATVAWGLVLLLIGTVARRWGSVLEAGLSIASLVYGVLLGVFLLGVLTRRVGERAAIAGMIAGVLLMAWVKLFTAIAWTWYVSMVTATTFAVGILMSFFLKERENV
jgi:Na+/proline symporter